MPIFKKWETSDAPVLAIDIDGVISLFGFDQGEPGRGTENAPGEFHLIDGMLHCIALDTGPRLNRLADSYELVWASGWEDRANDHLPGILGLPELPYLTFDGRARFGTAHWKLEALEEYAGTRPLAWIDDSLDGSCYDWSEERPRPHPARSDRVRRGPARSPRRGHRAMGQGRLPDRRIEGRLARMGEIVPIIFLAVILKIPVLYGMWLIYWAVKEEPELEDLPGDADDHSFRRFRRNPLKPTRPAPWRPARRHRSGSARLPAGRPHQDSGDRAEARPRNGRPRAARAHARRQLRAGLPLLSR